MNPRERLQKVAESFEYRFVALFAIASYGLRTGAASYLHPRSIDNPNLRNNLYKLASHVKVSFA